LVLHYPRLNPGLCGGYETIVRGDSAWGYFVRNKNRTLTGIITLLTLRSSTPGYLTLNLQRLLVYLLTARDGQHRLYSFLRRKSKLEIDSEEYIACILYDV
jgi:hypothetical protein